MAQNFNPWISMIQKAAPNGLGILPEAQNSQIDEIQKIFGTTPMGKPTPAGFVPNPTPKGSQPQVVPPPQAKKPPFDPFADVANPLDDVNNYAPPANIYADETPAVMDEIDSLPELQAEPMEETIEPNYAPENPVDDFIPDAEEPLTAQPTTTPLGVLPSELQPSQPAMMPSAPVDTKTKFSQSLEAAINNYSDQQSLAQDEIDKMKQGLSRYAKESGGVDFTPLAALSDAWFGGNLTAAAKQIAPPSNAERLKTMSDMQDRITQAQTGLSKDQLDALKLKISQESFGLQRENALKIAELQAQARRDAAKATAGRLGIQEDKLSSAAANLIDNDNIIKKAQTQLQQMDNDKLVLDSAEVLTPQVFNEIQIGVARAIAGGSQNAVSREEKTEYKTLNTDLAAIKQRLSGKPEDINSPEIRGMLSHMIERLSHAYKLNSYNRGKQILKGREKVYKNNPTALEVMKDKVESYRPEPVVNPVTGEQEWTAADEQRLKELSAKRGKK